MKKTAVENALESLKIAKLELERQLSDIIQAIKSLGGDDIDDSAQPSTKQVLVTESGYDTNWSWAEKFLYILKRENRFLHFREAAEMVVAIEGGDVDQVNSKMSSSTNSLKNNGTIVKFQASSVNQDTFWGSPKWLEDGKILEGHEYNPRYMRKKKANPALTI